MSTRQGIQRVTSRKGRGWQGFFLAAFRGARPPGNQKTLTVDCWPSERWENKFLLFLAKYQFCGTLSCQPWERNNCGAVHGGAEQGTGHNNPRWWWRWQRAELKNPAHSTSTRRLSSWCGENERETEKTQGAQGSHWCKDRKEEASGNRAGALEGWGAGAVFRFSDYLINTQAVREEKGGRLCCKDRTGPVETWTSHQASWTPQPPCPLVKHASVNPNFRTTWLSPSFPGARDLPQGEKLGSKTHSHGFTAISTCGELVLCFKIFRKINKASHNCWLICFQLTDSRFWTFWLFPLLPLWVHS